MGRSLRVFSLIVAVFLLVSAVGVITSVAQEKPVYGFPEAFPEIHAFF